MAVTGWFDGTKRVIKGEGGLLLAIVGLAFAFTSMGGMRLNALDGIYPVEFSLMLRHVLSAAAALGTLAVYAVFNRRNACGNSASIAKSVAEKPAAEKPAAEKPAPGNPPVASYVLSRTPRRVGLLALLCSLSLVLRYSQYLLTTSNPMVVMVGRVLEEMFGVLLILAWAERIVGHGFRATLSCFGLALVCFAALQILLSFFQRVPSMLALAMFPLVSWALFRSYCSRMAAHSGERAGEGSGEAKDAGPQRGLGVRRDTGLIPIDLSRASSLCLYFGTLFAFIYISGQMLGPTLPLQRQDVSSQLSIALGNLLAGLCILLAAERLSAAAGQPRLVLSVVFLALFALATFALAIQNSLSGVFVGIYLVLTSVGTQFANAMIWMAPFVTLPRGWVAPMAVACGYAANLLARTVSSASMLVACAVDDYPMGIVVGLVLVVAFALCIALIWRMPDAVRGSGAEGGPAESCGAGAGGPKTPFDQVVEQVAADCGLTGQEGRVLALCATGMNAREISEEMTVSLNTTKSHMRMLYAKLGVHSQGELIELVEKRLDSLGAPSCDR